MKILLFVNGPAGVGKTTVSEIIHAKLAGSAWLQGEWSHATNPFDYNSEMNVLTERNMSFLLRSYFECSQLRYVILTWGLHGPRQAIFDTVMHKTGDIDYRLLSFTLTCSKEEHLRRLRQDGRDAERIESNLDARPFYESLPYPVIDTTGLTVEETADIIIARLDAVVAEPAVGPTVES